jgi:hypothetical protein
VKKREKGKFGTAGKKAGAKLRHKRGKNKATDDDGSKLTSQTSATSLPSSPADDEIDDQGRNKRLVYKIDSSVVNYPIARIREESILERCPY